jgi:methylated-DNA-[protein]-cysteine S-methyltransferase
MKLFYYNFPLCELGIAEDNGAICHVIFNRRKKPEKFEEKETPLIKEAAKQLREYFGYKRKTFDLPIAPRGTEFQKKVWNALLDIPYGETRSYGEIAAITGNPKASRAVGMANNRNSIVIIIPCHRVIGADGSLTGFGGGLDLKQQLLDLEVKCVGQQAQSK